MDLSCRGCGKVKDIMKNKHGFVIVCNSHDCPEQANETQLSYSPQLYAIWKNK